MSDRAGLVCVGGRLFSADAVAAALEDPLRENLCGSRDVDPEPLVQIRGSILDPQPLILLRAFAHESKRQHWGLGVSPPFHQRRPPRRLRFREDLDQAVRHCRLVVDEEALASDGGAVENLRHEVVDLGADRDLAVAEVLAGVVPSLAQCPDPRKLPLELLELRLSLAT